MRERTRRRYTEAYNDFVNQNDRIPSKKELAVHMGCSRANITARSHELDLKFSDGRSYIREQTDQCLSEAVERLRHLKTPVTPYNLFKLTGISYGAIARSAARQDGIELDIIQNF